ncbi:MAG: TonB-dependent receptor domain-containing protein [Terriglobia bacterium]
MHKLSKWLWVALVFLLPTMAWSQGDRGALTGVVTDPTGAVVPEATLTITETRTGVVTTAASSSAGYYRVPVPPGTYRMEASKEGFKTAVAENITVPVAQVVTIDLTLQIGARTESVTVTSEAPLLTPSTADVGASVSPQEFQTLPIAVDDGGRQPQTFIFSSLPGTTGDAWSGSINGGQEFSHQILIDGVTIGRYDLSGGAMAEYSPSTDAIGEFKVQMTTYSAEYGGTSSAIVNFAMKSGTNQFHGTAFEYNKNPISNAAGLLSNAFGTPKSNAKENNFGGTFGGPIRRDKTFFFGSYEGDRFTNFAYSGTTTIPTKAMRAGDFSSFLGDEVGTDALGRPVFANELFDPTTTRTVAAGAQDPVSLLFNNSGDDAVIRDPFSYQGNLNVIDPAKFSTATSVLLPLMSDPLFPGNRRNTPRFSGSTPVLRRDAVTVKVDHAINDNHKLSGMFGYYRRSLWKRNTADSAYPPFPGQPISTYKNQEVVGPQARFSYTWTINDHSVNNLVLAYNRTNNANNLTDNAKYTPQLGIPGVPDNCFPRFSFRTRNSGVQFMSALGVGCANIDPSESYVYQDTYSTTRGKHSLKFGADFIRYRYNTNEPGALSGSFSFSSVETDLPGFTGSTGHPFASFLMGAADGANRSVYVTEPGYRAGELSLFAQDDWRATPKLTLNIGLRWQLPLPKREAFNRQSGFDPTLANPAADGFLGALSFLGNCSGCINRTSFQDWYFKEFGPRLGIAYQISKNLVLRGGYGISYGPPILNNFGSQNIYGFNSSVPTHHAPGAAGTVDPVIYLSPLVGATPGSPANPNPGIGLPAFTGTLPNRDPSQANGDSLDFLPRKSLAQPYVQNWSAGFQYQLPHEVLFEANYVGSKGTRLLESNFSNWFNQTDSKYMALGDHLDDGFQDALDAGILDPYGITGPKYSTFADSSCDGTVANALAPYPQYCGLTNNYPTMGNSTYHSLQLTARKNSTSGLTFIAAYTFSKTITDTDTALYYPSYYVQDFYNRRLEKSIAGFDHPQSLKLTWIYSLPFGRGQRFLASAGKLDRLVSGWQITAIQQYISGDPLVVSSSLGARINPAVRADIVSGTSQTVPTTRLDVENGTQFLNPDAFADPPSSPDNGYPLRLGTGPRFLPNVRGPVHLNEDFGIIKNTRITESISFQFRADMFNVFNRTGLGNPDTALGDGSDFGKVFGPMNGPRIIQFAVRLNF